MLSPLNPCMKHGKAAAVHCFITDGLSRLGWYAAGLTWKRLSSPGSFSMNFLYLSADVQPTTRTSPLQQHDSTDSRYKRHSAHSNDIRFCPVKLRWQNKPLAALFAACKTGTLYVKYAREHDGHIRWARMWQRTVPRVASA
jgi:hypothetical protein